MFNPTIGELEIIYEGGCDCPVNDGNVRLVARKEKEDEETLERHG